MIFLLFFSNLCKHEVDFSFYFVKTCVDDSSEVEGVDLGTFGQTISPPPRFPRNDDEHDNYHDIDDL